MSKALYNSEMILSNPSNLKYIKGIDNSGNDCISDPISVSVTSIQTSGTEIAKININGTNTSIKAPNPTLVTVASNQSTGNEIGTVTINGVPTKLKTGPVGGDISTILSTIYPVGSIYLDASNATVCPIQTAGVGTWTKVEGRYLLGSGTLVSGEVYNAGSTPSAGLPNITGSFDPIGGAGYPGDSAQYLGVRNTSGCFSGSSKGTIQNPNGGGDVTDSEFYRTLKFNASSSNSIYGSSNTVRPPAFVVNIWKRTA